MATLVFLEQAPESDLSARGAFSLVRIIPLGDRQVGLGGRLSRLLDRQPLRAPLRVPAEGYPFRAPADPAVDHERFGALAGDAYRQTFRLRVVVISPLAGRRRWKVVYG